MGEDAQPTGTRISDSRRIAALIGRRLDLPRASASGPRESRHVPDECHRQRIALRKSGNVPSVPVFPVFPVFLPVFPPMVVPPIVVVPMVVLSASSGIFSKLARTGRPVLGPASCRCAPLCGLLGRSPARNTIAAPAYGG